MVDDDVLDWLRRVHQTTRWTASVCTGALILGAAGILKGAPATTHWYKMGVLRIMGTKPRPDERIVHSGKIVTAAGVSAGVDLGLWLAGEIVGQEQAEAIQLVIEYDPHPPFDAGHMRKASRQVQRLAKDMIDTASLQTSVASFRRLPGGVSAIWFAPANSSQIAALFAASGHLTDVEMRHASGPLEYPAHTSRLL